MKILHFYKTYFPETMGGVEQVINQLARGAMASDVETKVLTLSANKVECNPIELDGHEVYRARSMMNFASTPLSLSAVRQFSQLSQWADIIHYHYPYPFADLLHLMTRVRKPSILTYHSDIVKQKYLLTLYRPLQKYFLGRVDRIVATSPNYLNTSPVLDQYREKVDIIPIGLDKQSYPVASTEKIKQYQQTFGEKFFLFIGVLRYYKGLHILLDAAKNTDYPIVIAGGGPFEQALKKQAADLNLKHIHFLGFVSADEKVALLNACYAVLFPSHLRSEAFGISLLEGAMYGKPMVSCEIGTGTTFINIDQQTGLVVPPNDTAALRHAMDELWQHPEKAAELGRCAEQRYWDKFTASNMLESYCNLYQTLYPTP